MVFIIGHIVSVVKVFVYVFFSQISCFLIAGFFMVYAQKSRKMALALALVSGAHQHDYVFIRMGMARIVHL